MSPTRVDRHERAKLKRFLTGPDGRWAPRPPLIGRWGTAPREGGRTKGPDGSVFEPDSNPPAWVRDPGVAEHLDRPHEGEGEETRTKSDLAEGRWPGRRRDRSDGGQIGSDAQRHDCCSVVRDHPTKRSAPYATTLIDMATTTVVVGRVTCSTAAERNPPGRLATSHPGSRANLRRIRTSVQ